MKRIKVKAPAKVNLTLEVLSKRDDGFHNIQSIMQAISLYDYLTFEIKKSDGLKIRLSGSSGEIPYDESNIVYKAAKKFFERAGITNIFLDVYIEKHIPVAAGLAGGSSDAAAAIYALNKLFENFLSDKDIDDLCASLGSDINFCLTGGCKLCTSRGEITENLPVFKQSVSLIKPKNLGISAKEAYTRFAALSDKSIPDNTAKLKELLIKGKFDKSLIYNSLEKALFPVYTELLEIKCNVKNSLMSGSGSTFFVLDSHINTVIDKTKYDIFENCTTINSGVEETDD